MHATVPVLPTARFCYISNSVNVSRKDVAGVGGVLLSFACCQATQVDRFKALRCRLKVL